MQIVNTQNAPQAIGPYSQVVKSGGLLFGSGQIPLTVDGEMVAGGIEPQAQQVLANIRALLDSQGLGMENVIKTTIFMQDLAEFAIVNEIYAEAFGGHKPARSTVQMAGLPKGARIEIEFIAELG